MRDKKVDVPGRSSEPPKCRRERDGVKCDKPATGEIKTSVMIYDKEIPVRLPMCGECLEELGGRDFTGLKVSS